jgi:hypothetical protein
MFTTAKLSLFDGLLGVNTETAQREHCEHVERGASLSPKKDFLHLKRARVPI